jgi:nitrite reductase/ring-hydroxylating ferredoxin subunit
VSARDVKRYVADLLDGCRPRPFRADAEDAAQIRAAIELAAAGDPGAPRPDFVEDLARRLQSAEASAPTATNVRSLHPTRLRVLVAGSVAAGAAAIGAAGDHLLSGGGGGEIDQAQPAATLTPNVGTWQTVANSTDLPTGGVHRFDFGSVVGFVSRGETGLRAVSGVCTHLGCRLNLDAGARQLNCPCHDSSFTVDGALLHYQLRTAPPPLPHLQVREREGVIEVLVPV